MLTKFVLGNILARTTGLKFPPFWLFNQSQNKMVDSSEYEEIMKKSEEELISEIKANAFGVPMVMPLEIRTDDTDWWTLPLEPLISITGKNIITKRRVSKGQIRGSIKERWAQDDYQINIQGVLINPDVKAYPAKEVEKLRKLCEAARWEVRCPLFEIFSIYHIVIDDYKFPFTTGKENQGYDITATSDDMYKLLLKRQDIL